MTDAVTSRVLKNTPTLYGIHLTRISDGTGESAVVKVDKSTLTDPGTPSGDWWIVIDERCEGAFTPEELA